MPVPFSAVRDDYFGVRLQKPGKPKPYQAQVRRGGKTVTMGNFATAEEAALFVARTPEGQVAARSSSRPKLPRQAALVGREDEQSAGCGLPCRP